MKEMKKKIANRKELERLKDIRKNEIWRKKNTDTKKDTRIIK